MNYRGRVENQPMSARVIVSLLILCTGCRGETTGSANSRVSPPPAPPSITAEAGTAPAPDGLDVEIAPGLTLRELRRATAVLAEKARRSGNKNTVSLPVCIGLESAGLVARCTDIGTLGYGPIDRASFELRDPTEGQGLIYHYGSRADFDQALHAFETFERDHGTFVVANVQALVIFSGAEQLSEADKQIVRQYIGSLP